MSLIWLFKGKKKQITGFDQIPAKFNEADGRRARSEINKFINSNWNKEELPEEWKVWVVVLIYKKGDKTDCSNYRGISILPNTYKILSKILQSRLTPYAEEIIGDHQCRFHATGQLLIIYSVFGKYLRKYGNTTKQYIRILWTSRKLMIQLGGRSFLVIALSLVSP